MTSKNTELNHAIGRRHQAKTGHRDFSIPVIQMGMNRSLRTRTVGGVVGDG